MMKSHASARFATPFAVLATIAVFAPTIEAADPLPLSAQILGEVRDPDGDLMMGASIALYDSHEQLVGRAMSDLAGKFVFADVPAGIYAVHVSLARFVPAMRRNRFLPAPRTCCASTWRRCSVRFNWCRRRRRAES